METGSIFEALAVSLGLGLLVGLQRERAGSKLAGVRTFPLVTMLGTLCALLDHATQSGWATPTGLIAIAGVTAMANFLLLRQDGHRDAGTTTEVALLVMYAAGAFAAVGPKAVALAVGVVVAVLLQAKGRLHGLAAKIGDKDILAILQFAAITFVVLPVLPDRTFGPLDVLNPRNIWMMVVLVVGMSLAGYIAYKLMGANAGTVLNGILGGLISSTATTVTFSRRARESDAYSIPALLIITIASGVVYARLLGEISVIAPGFVGAAVGPLGVMLTVSAALALAVWLRCGHAGDGLPEQENPTQLKGALFFAGLYAVVLLAVAAARLYLGERGVYAVAAVSGLTDMDAITLSTSRLVANGEMQAGSGWRAILVAAISNLVFKGGVVATLGSVRLARLIAVVFGIEIAAAGGLILLWP